MKFLTDVNIEKFIIEFLKQSGYDVKLVSEINPALSDTDIINIAYKEKRIVITNDKDFGELVFKHKKKTSGIILFREIKKDKKLLFLNKILKQINKQSFFIVIKKDKIVKSLINEK